MAQFIRPTQLAQSKLNDFEGKIVALRYLGETEIDTVIDGVAGRSKAVRADLAQTDGKTATHEGEVLVFPRVLMDTIRQANGAFVVGKLTRQKTKSFDDRSYVVLEDLDEAEYAAATSKLQSVLR